MKTIIMIAIRLLLSDVGHSVGGLPQELPAKMTFLIKDDFGNPVPDLEFFAVSYSPKTLGDNQGDRLHQSFCMKTNKKGEAVVETKTPTGSFDCLIFDKQIYGIRRKAGRIRLRRGFDTWVPWNPTIEFEVARIFKPIPMYVSDNDRKIPAFEKEFGFDLKMDDFVAPYGRGIHTDFTLKIEEKIPYSSELSPYDYRLKISFPNKGDGIQSHFTLPHSFRNNLIHDSRVIMPRYAPTVGYKDSLELRCGYVDGKHLTSREDENYFLRVRTKFDKDGKIASALYGKIDAPLDFFEDGIIRFRYCLNPTPLDLNMEEKDGASLVPPLSKPSEEPIPPPSSKP
ncbi:MAG: hypothetical protein LBG65_07780 [Puniceicoccales bacterium]|jgi:hypothetical protein|nr:hypothetical protein [Puniceicoccales bacterium]